MAPRRRPMVVMARPLGHADQNHQFMFCWRSVDPAEYAVSSIEDLCLFRVRT